MICSRDRICVSLDALDFVIVLSLNQVGTTNSCLACLKILFTTVQTKDHVSLLLIHCCVSIALAPLIRLPDATAPLKSEDAKAVRSAVYENDPLVGTRDADMLRILDLPEPLRTCYNNNNNATIELLLIIVEGGRPRDSVLAAGYAFELVGGPGRGVACIRVFSEISYDDMDDAWGATPRKHWMSKIKDKRLQIKNK